MKRNLITVDLPPELKRKLKQHCKERGLLLYRVVRSALEGYLQQQDGRSARKGE